MAKQLEVEIKVGLFLTIGIGLILVGILVLGSTESLLERKLHYRTHFPAVDGLVPGAKVAVGGIPVGTVTRLEFDRSKREIVVSFSVARSSSEWIRKDSSVEIVTQGVLGDKYLNLKAGSLDQPAAEDGSELVYTAGKDLSQFLTKGDSLIVSLNSIAGSVDRIMKSFERDGRSEIFFKGLAATARNLSSSSEKLGRELDQMQIRSAVNHLNGILEKINNGQGTLGALVNDPSLYDDAKALLGGANRNRVVRNLVRQTIKDNEKASDKNPDKSKPGP